MRMKQRAQSFSSNFLFVRTCTVVRRQAPRPSTLDPTRTGCALCTLTLAPLLSKRSTKHGKRLGDDMMGRTQAKCVYLHITASLSGIVEQILPVEGKGNQPREGNFPNTPTASIAIPPLLCRRARLPSGVAMQQITRVSEYNCVQCQTFRCRRRSIVQSFLERFAGRTLRTYYDVPIVSQSELSVRARKCYAPMYNYRKNAVCEDRATYSRPMVGMRFAFHCKYSAETSCCQDRKQRSMPVTT